MAKRVSKNLPLVRVFSNEMKPILDLKYTKMAGTMIMNVKKPVTKSKGPFDAVLGADLHLREDTPACRTDDYQFAQFKKLAFIRDLCEENQCPFLVAGDIFHHWKPSPYLLAQTLQHLPRNTIVVPGQHDLPQHNLEELSKTGLNVLKQAGRVNPLSGGRSAVLGAKERDLGGIGMVHGYAFGEEPLDLAFREHTKLRNVLLWHRLTCLDSQPWPGAGAVKLRSLSDRYNGYDLIVTGDNHQTFCIQCNDSFLVNPGSMMRMTADQVDFQPAVFGWVAKDNRIVGISLPIQKGVVSREHIPEENKQDRDVRMASYIRRVQKQFETGLSFEKNLEAHFQKHKEREGVETAVWKAMGK